MARSFDLAITLLALLAAHFGATSAGASERPYSTASRANTLVVAGTGIADAFDAQELAVSFVEVRFDENRRGLKPWVGLNAIERGAFWVGAGLRYEFELNRGWRIALSLAPGYFEGDDVLDLGDRFEVLSTIEISTQVSQTARLGVSLGHLSNGGVGPINPGTELARIFFVLPWEHPGRSRKAVARPGPREFLHR